ncbi:sulfotransferase [Paracoccus saliphilus]|uniref:Sulfotransferase family protein n=2 Tax=Paracoccus saliphilus TaxID=405559 RepID=A0AA45W8H7_9RHOB|nr:sulfotransferase [Paracoccus saliphilus]SIT17098.1 Sulfotransferase family protein [Paracoccus saliphilus]
MTKADPMPGGLILGSARCGSTLISRILRSHPDILSLSELFSTAGPWAFRPDRLDGARFWSQLAKPSRTLSQVGNPSAAPGEFLYGNVSQPAHDPYLCPPILAITLPHLSSNPDALFRDLATTMEQRGDMELGDHYRALFTDLSVRMGGRGVWVERSGGSLVAAETLRRMFPEARPVLLLRDGPETALSMRDYPAVRLAIWMWRHLRHFGIDLLHPQYHYGRGRIWPLLSAIGGRFGLSRILDTRPSLQKTGAFWSAVTKTGLEGLKGAAPLILRYEELCNEPRREVERLGLFLTGSAPESWLDRAETFPRKPSQRMKALTRWERRELQDACAPGERALAELS